MAALEASLSLFTLPSSSSSSKYSLSSKPVYSVKLRHSTTINTCLNFRNISYSLPLLSIDSARKLGFVVCSTIEEVAVVAEPEQSLDVNQKRKLYLFNLPWSLSVVDIRNLFSECGTVKDVEIIKQKTGRSRGFAFVTMASGEEAQAVIDKFDAKEISGRIIRVELAKRFKKPSPPAPIDPPIVETRHKLYVSNLAWKARSSHLRELFAAYNPVSVRVVFDAPSGRSSGYGFVSFTTQEEADEALSTLDGKELMGRPLRLKVSERNVDASEKENEETPSEE